MNDLTTATLVLACTFGGTLLGVWLSRKLPENHLNDRSRDTVKLGTGLTATMTALILGLVTASAKSDFDAANAAVRQGAAKVSMLDRVLARYGPGTSEIRAGVRRHLAARIDSMWPEEGARDTAFDSLETTAEIEQVVDRIGALAPDTDARRALRTQALSLGNDVLQLRWTVLQRDAQAVPAVFLVILTCWLSLTFTSFGLLAPCNATTVGVLFLSALSVSASIFLLLELADPFDGVVKVSSGPLRYALDHAGR